MVSLNCKSLAVKLKLQLQISTLHSWRWILSH